MICFAMPGLTEGFYTKGRIFKNTLYFRCTHLTKAMHNQKRQPHPLIREDVRLKKESLAINLKELGAKTS
jgi:hypothetical protein